ncbi:MAG TPA: response regulator [Nitrospirota bacterium]|nr:response regulator [Nitrospirota bacterium]
MDKKAFRILVADDDDIALDVVSMLLSREGYSVAPVKDGLEAIDRLRLEEFHLVITDLMMPGAGGIEVLKYASRSNADIAVVILTAYGTLDTTLEAIKEGAYDYLTKPFRTQEISIIAERAYQRALLIADNRDLKRSLRDTYRDMEIIKTVAASGNPEVTTAWLERIERLRTMNVLLAGEAEVLKERLVRGNGKGQNINSG